MFSLQAVYPPPNEKDIRDIKTKIGDIKTKDGENDQRERFWANLDSVGKEAKEQLLYGADPDHKTVLLYGEALVAAAAAEAENYAASNLTITKSSKESIADNFGVPKDGPEKATAEAAVKRHKDAQGTRCSLGKAAHLGCAQLCVHAHARHARACV